MLKNVYFTLIMLGFLFSPHAFSYQNVEVNPAFACQNAESTEKSNFCSSFTVAAKCHCVANGLGPACQSVDHIAARLTSFFGSLDKACRVQRNTTPQNCLDSWNCYLYGGVDSFNRPCNATGIACPKS
ncbi:MAG: hypothetical protein H0U70_11675 [Tatlockia sp.]|nr:hypothetical protein [Tatlockia sp.]